MPNIHGITTRFEKERLMKRSAHRTSRAPVAPAEFDLSVPLGNLADYFEDPVSENLVDYEDEREAVEVVAPGMIGSVH